MSTLDELEKKIAEANRREAIAEAHRESALARRDKAFTSLKTEFGVENLVQAEELKLRLEEELEKEIISAESALEESR